MITDPWVTADPDRAGQDDGQGPGLVDFRQESVSMCAACGGSYTGSYDDHQHDWSEDE